MATLYDQMPARYNLKRTRRDRDNVQAIAALQPWAALKTALLDDYQRHDLRVLSDDLKYALVALSGEVAS